MGREKRKSKMAEDIIRLQNDDGTWGNSFHSLGIPRRKHFLTTEQALRRLKVLGFTMEDDPIQKTVHCMTSCLRGERKIDGCREKTHDWDLFIQLMLSTWIRMFEPDNELAFTFAMRWAGV